MNEIPISCRTCLSEYLGRESMKEPCVYCHGHSHWEPKRVERFVNKHRGTGKGQTMPEKAVVKEIGFYETPTANGNGYVGWIKTIDGCYFIDVDGKITKPEM